MGLEKWDRVTVQALVEGQDSLSAGISFVLARPTTLEFFPHSCDLSEIRGPALGSFLASDLPGAPYDKTVWDRLTAMWAFDHARSLEKGLLFCQQRVIRLIGPLATRTPPTENTQIEFLLDCSIRDEGRSISASCSLSIHSRTSDGRRHLAPRPDDLDELGPRIPWRTFGTE